MANSPRWGENFSRCHLGGKISEGGKENCGEKGGEKGEIEVLKGKIKAKGTKVKPKSVRNKYLPNTGMRGNIIFKGMEGEYGIVLSIDPCFDAKTNMFII